ncbi:aldo/keto reductase [Salinisphaera dokdonensis CL-ES53]|uniref:Aldo/keto reductase n=1 Tax=Salinisphaera dokdonensis CL-ES53 TaxID=1304272 RepID=A0ABV2AVW1_9GAMM
MKLALGTAQFGLDYGIANRNGRVSAAGVREILGVARQANIDTLDTAAAYGTSEEALGSAGVDDFSVVTKLPPIPEGVTQVSQWVERSIERSLASLGVTALSAVLFHRPMQLLDKQGEAAYDALLAVKARGAVGRVGISIYEPAELDALDGKLSFDLVQAPLNILDRRLISSGWLERLGDQGIEVHARSVFLQGLLLMQPRDRSAYFQPWERKLERYDRWLAEHKLSALEACLGFACHQPSVGRVIVGVESSSQLRALIAAIPQSGVEPPGELETRDQGLINPATWKL